MNGLPWGTPDVRANIKEQCPIVVQLRHRSEYRSVEVQTRSADRGTGQSLNCGNRLPCHLKFFVQVLIAVRSIFIEIVCLFEACFFSYSHLCYDCLGILIPFNARFLCYGIDITELSYKFSNSTVTSKKYFLSVFFIILLLTHPKMLHQYHSFFNNK